jgi:hypothetical protein
MDARIAPKINTLYHIIARRNDATDNTMIVNGEDVSGPVTARTLADNALALAIGRYSASALFPWNGLIDKVALYKSYLPDARCIAHWVAGASEIAVPAGSATKFGPF